MQARPIRSFTEALGLLSRGRFVEKCDESLQKALETLGALPDGKGKATITLTIDIAAQEDRLELKPTIKVKLPEEKGFAGTPFWNYEGALSVQHPSQFDMFNGPRDAEERRRERDAS